MAERELDTLGFIDLVLQAPQFSVMALLNNLFLQIARLQRLNNRRDVLQEVT
jgi:hypothetical protein